jgi:dolichol-phosphate mannosyltransferase
MPTTSATTAIPVSAPARRRRWSTSRERLGERLRAAVLGSAVRSGAAVFSAVGSPSAMVDPSMFGSSVPAPAPVLHGDGASAADAALYASGPMTVDVWLIIPTYDEAANVEGIVTASREQLQQAVPGNFRILVVDDNSPDGTGEIADRMAADDPVVEVLHRPGKAGLGQAYLAGFAHAMTHGAETLIEMDADFSHDPAYLPALLEASQTADVVLGSRYVPGGGVRDWGLVRQLISRGGGFYARRMLGVSVRDLTGGFKCLKRSVLEGIDLPSVRAEGYVFQIEVTYRAILAGFTVREVPIVFCDRTEGKSKMSSRIALEAIIRVPELKREAASAVARAGSVSTTPRPVA